MQGGKNGVVQEFEGRVKLDLIRFESIEWLD
jgi:hypothetical protein